jgi:hypothetical protein
MTSSGVQHFHHPDVEDRGLGIGRITHQKYFTGELVVGNKLLIAPNPAVAWTVPVLEEMYNLEMEELGRRLLRGSGETLNAVLVLTESGKGSARILRPLLAQSSDDASPSDAMQPQPTSGPTLKKSAVQENPDVLMEQPFSSYVDPPETITQPTHVSDFPVEQSPVITERHRRSSSIMSGMAAFGRALITTLNQASQSIAKLIRRMLPDEQFFSLPTSTMAFIAIAVPLVVTAVAASVYFQRGQGQLYADYMLDAQGAMAQAQQFEKESEQYIAWRAVIGYLDLAEGYRVTEDSQSLRNFSNLALDTLDRVTRIEFFPTVIEGLPVSVEITRIIPTRDNDLYLLNGSDSTVLRVVPAGQGYRLDTTFRCGPVPTLSGLIDIAAAAPNTQGVAVMGIDAAGNILQCIPGGAEPLNFPIPLADYHQPRAFAMDDDDLFLLTENAVWIYRGEEGYRSLPLGFFGDQVPATMDDIIDFTVKDGNLYLLHRDGKLTTDQRDQNTLKDPDLFHNLPRIDDGVAIIEGVEFSAMHWAAPPDASLYFLDAEAQVVYRFNSQLIYQQQYQAQNALPDERITAFAVSPGHQRGIKFLLLCAIKFSTL